MPAPSSDITLQPITIGTEAASTTPGVREIAEDLETDVATATETPDSGDVFVEVQGFKLTLTGHPATVEIRVKEETVKAIRANRNIILHHSQALLAAIVENLEHSPGSNQPRTTLLFDSFDEDFLDEIRRLREALERFIELMEAEDVDVRAALKLAVDWSSHFDQCLSQFSKYFIPGPALALGAVAAYGILDVFGIPVSEFIALTKALPK